ncbi:MAG: FHA domain-containing protein, partial [Lewinella sp.]|nr:FHA domain-containing protein [Lewinella sp.]
AQLLTQVRNLDSLFMIHCIGFGSDVDSTILKQIVDASPNPDDKYSFAPEPDDISDIMTDLTKGQSYNLKLSVHPDDFCEYIGNTRQISLHFNYKNTILTASHAYSYGQPGAGKQSLCIGEEQKSFMELLPYAMGLVTALLIIFLTIFPFIARRRFQAKYVKRFKEVKTSNNMIVKDPITATVIQDNDKVVAYVCDHVNLLQSWKDNGDRCGVRDCYKGSAKYSTSSNFFKQSSDTTRRLNWIWFGALGGAIGWLLFKILESMGRNDGSGLLGMFSDQTNIASYNDAMSTGAGLGFGIALAFAFVEEKGQSRALDWRRILLRAVLGLFLGGIIFVLMYLIFLNVIQQFNLDFVSQFFAWLLFGMLLAVLTSVRSSIELRSALFSGLLASVAGFLVYYWSTNTGWIANDQVGKIVGMIAYGAILGVIMDTVRSSLEDFSLEFLSPAHVQRKNPISKWLKEEGAEIMIGSSPQAHVYIKWDAQVKDHHAALTYEGGKVFIVPRAQTIVNGRVLRSKASLENNDIIKLGDKSITTLRFISASREINRQKEAGTRPQNDSGIEFYS